MDVGRRLAGMAGIAGKTEEIARLDPRTFRHREAPPLKMCEENADALPLAADHDMVAGGIFGIHARRTKVGKPVRRLHHVSRAGAHLA